MRKYRRLPGLFARKALAMITILLLLRGAKHSLLRLPRLPFGKPRNDKNEIATPAFCGLAMMVRAISI
jgi:hypothetical protein